MFKLALIQMLVEGGKKTGNLDRAKRSICEAAANGGEMVLLPEAVDLGWTHPSVKTDANSIPDGETCQDGVDAEKILYANIEIIERPARGNGWKNILGKNECQR